MVPWNSASEGFAYNWQSKWVGIIAIKTEKTQIHFLSDVLVAVASLDLLVPIKEFKQRRFWATHVNRKWTFSTLEPWFWTNFWANRLYKRIKTLGNTNLVASRLTKREKRSPPVDVRRCVLTNFFPVPSNRPRVLRESYLGSVSFPWIKSKGYVTRDDSQRRFLA